MSLPRIAFVIEILFFSFASSFAQVDNIGSGHCLKFDGIDDYVDLGDIYDNVQFPVTVSVWVWISPSAIGGMPVFDSQSNLQVYAGFYLSVSPTTIGIGYGDGTGEYDPSFRRGKQQTVPYMAGRWVNVTTIIRGATDMDIYLNGNNVGGSYVGSSNLPMGAFAAEVAKIGFRNTNDFPVYFQGMIDDLRVFNISLSEAQVRQMMCKKLTGSEPGLIGYWTMDETAGSVLTDKSVKGFNGQLMNGVARDFSGAPLGDDSNYSYSAPTTFSMADGSNQVTVSNIQGSPEGIQIYKVKSMPSQTGGLNLPAFYPPYFGVFVASTDSDNTFSVKYDYQNSSACKLSTRDNNSVANWVNATNPDLSVKQFIEVIGVPGAKVSFDLGADKIICDQSSVIISTGLTDPNLTYSWSNGMNTSSISVSKSGKYVVKVTNDCGIVKDSLAIAFVTSPTAFDLGADQKVCLFKPFKAKPITDTTGMTFLWQDGSAFSTHRINDFGTYWLTVKNYCGQVSDTIHIVKNDKLDYTKLPNVITPNGDGKNDVYQIPNGFLGELNLEVFNRWGKKVFQSIGYQNEWNGGDLDSGAYYLLISGACIDKVKLPITILR